MRSIFVVLMLWAMTFAAQADNWFFKDGKTIWKIYLPDNSGITEKYAACEFQRMLKKISNADFEIISGGKCPESHAVIIGPSGKAAFDEPDSFSIETSDGNLHLRGNRPRATLYAVYTFLQKYLGARWFWFADDGEYFKVIAEWPLPQLNHHETAAFKFRAMTPVNSQRNAASGYWLARNKINRYSKLRKVRDQTGMVKTPVCISSHLIKVPESMFKDHPDWFSMVNGKRIPGGMAGCWSNPGFTQYVVKKLVELAKESDAELMNVFPADITTRCQCPECIRNTDPSSRWYDYYYKLQQEIHKTLPRLHFAGIAYMEYRAVPTTKVKGLEYVMYCQSDRCYVHKFDDAKCKLNQKSLQELKLWTGKSKMAVYGYHFDVFDRPMLLPIWNILADEIRYYHKHYGIAYMKTEYPFSRPGKGKPENMYHITSRLAGYIYAQLLWDPNQSVDAIIDDWCKYIFGPAASELAAYYRKMAKAWENSGTHLTYYTHPPQGFAGKFINRGLIEFAEKQFKTASIKLKNNPRELKQLKIEIAVFNKWKRAAQSLSPTLNVIKAASAERIPVYRMIDRKGKITDTKIQIYRNDSALLIKVFCPNIPGLADGYAGHDKFWGRGPCDVLELFLNFNDGSEYRHFAMNRGGGWFDALGTDKNWNINWKRKITKMKNAWIAEIELPFAELKVNPENGSQWKVTLNRYTKPLSGFPVSAFHDPSSGATLNFSDMAKPGRNLVWISTRTKKISSFFPDVLRTGWNYRYFDTPSKVLEHDISDVQMIILTVSNWNEVPKSLFSRKLIPAVRNGAILLIEAPYPPLDRYFNDKSFALRFGQKDLLEPRKASFPPDIPIALQKTFPVPPPAYYLPREPGKWKVLGRIELKNGSKEPFLLSRCYGKGVIFITKFNGGWPRSAKYVVPRVNELYEKAKVLSQ